MQDLQIIHNTRLHKSYDLLYNQMGGVYRGGVPIISKFS